MKGNKVKELSVRRGGQLSQLKYKLFYTYAQGKSPYANPPMLSMGDSEDIVKFHFLFAG